MLAALAHLGDGGNIGGTFDAVHPIQLCQLRAGVAVKLVEVAEQGGKPLVSIPEEQHSITDSRDILIQFHTSFQGGTHISGTAIGFQIAKLPTCHICGNFPRQTVLFKHLRNVHGFVKLSVEFQSCNIRHRILSALEVQYRKRESSHQTQAGGQSGPFDPYGPFPMFAALQDVVIQFPEASIQIIFIHCKIPPLSDGLSAFSGFGSGSPGHCSPSSCTDRQSGLRIP